MILPPVFGTTEIAHGLLLSIDNNLQHLATAIKSRNETKMSKTLYPISYFPSFQTNEAESDPVFSAACLTVGVDPDDEEVSVVEVNRDEAIYAIQSAGKALPPFDEVDEGVYADRFFVVSGLDQGYCRLVHFRNDALCLPAQEDPRRV